MFQENHNPFGIGDVVIAKYTPGPGRPYWPGKVLSATGTYFWELLLGTKTKPVNCDVFITEL